MKTISILSAFILALFLAQPILAHETETSHEEPIRASSTATPVTFEDLGVTRTGLLPTNPFYFLKEWERKTRLFFAANPIRKAELELRFTNEKAAELKRVAENNPQDEEAIERAIENYNENIERLRVRLESLQETSDNPRIDDLLERLTDRTVKHQQLFEELKTKHQRLGERLEQTQNKVDETLSRVPEKLDNPDKFKERLERILEKQRKPELKNLEVRSRLLKIREKVEERVKDREGADAVACTQDAKLCSDGSYVGRVPPVCNFAPCPSEALCEGGECPRNGD